MKEEVKTTETLIKEKLKELDKEKAKIDKMEALIRNDQRKVDDWKEQIHLKVYLN